MSNAILSLRGVERTYKTGAEALPVLKGVDLDLTGGELVGLVAPSGAGKSTLLHVAGLLERPDGGDVLLDGQSCGAMGDAERTRRRCGGIGFVYQFHHLLPEFSALENVALAAMIGGEGKKAAYDRARSLLDKVGLSHRLDHRPARLSGGEQQRVAIARALGSAPRVLIADEPTGNLDPGTAAHVFDLLLSLAREGGLAALIATHNLDLAGRLDRVVTLKDGVIVQG